MIRSEREIYRHGTDAGVSQLLRAESRNGGADAA